MFIRHFCRWSNCFYFIKILFIFRREWKEEGRERNIDEWEKHWLVLSHLPPNQGPHPQPLVVQATLHPIESHPVRLDIYINGITQCGCPHWASCFWCSKSAKNMHVIEDFLFHGCILLHCKGRSCVCICQVVYAWVVSTSLVLLVMLLWTLTYSFLFDLISLVCRRGNYGSFDISIFNHLGNNPTVFQRGCTTMSPLFPSLWWLPWFPPSPTFIRISQWFSFSCWDLGI